ncbi:MAG TPA: hypothetical protein VFV31_00790 [Chitinophagaceae bacterium]|nr:hypothetical protein [Chitinophagaceae bacterium]
MYSRKRWSGLLSFLFVFSVNSHAQVAAVTFTVQVPSIDSAKGVYLAGSFNYWHAGDSLYRMKKTTPNRFTLTVPVFANQPYQYKYTLGHWDRVELSAADTNITNREFFSATGQQITDTVAKWNKPLTPAANKPTKQMQQINAMKDSVLNKLQPELGNMLGILKQYVQNVLREKPSMTLHRRLDKQSAKKIYNAYRQVSQLIWDIFATITPEQKKLIGELLKTPEAQQDYINALGNAFGTVVEGKNNNLW